MNSLVEIPSILKKPFKVMPESFKSVSSHTFLLDDKRQFPETENPKSSESDSVLDDHEVFPSSSLLPRVPYSYRSSSSSSSMDSASFQNSLTDICDDGLHFNFAKSNDPLLGADKVHPQEDTKIDVIDSKMAETGLALNSNVKELSPQHYRELLITALLYVLNIVSAVGIVLINKYIYTHFNFRFGVTLLLYHFTLTSAGLALLEHFKVFSAKHVNILQVLPVSVSFCSYVVLTNLSLQYNSGTFYQILVVPTIGVLQFFLYGIKTEAALIPPMLVMLLGVAIATMTEVKTSFFGLVIAFSGILMTAIYQILVGAKQRQLGLNAIQLLYYQAPLSSILLLIAMPFLNNLVEVVSFPYSSGLVLSIVASALCAFFLNLSMYLVLGRSNALTYNVIGLSKLFLVLALNYLVFEIGTMHAFNVIGVFTAFLGICYYSFVKFKDFKNESCYTKSH